MRTEYKQVQGTSIQEFEDALNKAGASGWQLHSWKQAQKKSGVLVVYTGILTRVERGYAGAR